MRFVSGNTGTVALSLAGGLIGVRTIANTPVYQW
eukprot:CAMPEP_0194526198 /NCGR_PEP_ID=MMETSP0253-20130528/61955_1 /TAXON_ID=2966 /ORGANISM="Noctiluca scintillans" /LENGTH=33 /DNA_ID= /DNA_START= /DNA_END= /DNA_ORIENTATION=